MGIWSKVFSKKSPDYDVKSSRRGFGQRGSVVVNEDASMQVAAFNRGVTYISTQIAKLPWDVKDKTNNLIEDNISKLLNLTPNPEMNAFTFRLWAVSTAIVHGNSFSEIERDTMGRAIAIWPLSPGAVELVRDENGQLLYKLTQGWGGSPQAAVYFLPKDIFHVRNFHTKDGLLGQGVVAYGTETLGITIAADRMASGIFNAGGIPSGVLSHPGTLSDEAYKRLGDSWKEQHGGRKSGGTAILEEGVKYEPINVAPDVLQFLESRQFGVLEIARFLGVPPTKLFDTSAATYSNVENANLEVATDTLDSWAVNLEMEADTKLLNNRFNGRFTELDLYAVFRGDMQTRSTYFKTMMSIGAMTPNQARMREGMPGYGKVGDNYYIATNNFTPVNRMDEVIDAQIASKKPDPATPEKDVTPEEEEDTGTKALNNAVIEFLKK